MELQAQDAKKIQRKTQAQARKIQMKTQAQAARRTLMKTQAQVRKILMRTQAQARSYQHLSMATSHLVIIMKNEILFVTKISGGAASLLLPIISPPPQEAKRSEIPT